MVKANVLLSSAGRRGELVKILRQSLGIAGLEGGVFAVDRAPHTSAGWLSDGLDLVPNIADDAFVPAVLEVCERRLITHLIPTLDPELPVYAQAVSEFKAKGVDVWVSSPEVIRITADKRLTHEWLTSEGFPAVDQVALSCARDLTLPLIAKVADGSSSVGLRRIEHWVELDGLDPQLDYVVERIAPGVEYTVDVLVGRGGATQCAVPRLRLETRAGEVSKGMTAQVPEVEALAAKVVERLPGAYGVLNVQIFHDPTTETLNVIEINARFGGGYPLTWEAGAQFPVWLLQESSGLMPSSASLAWSPDLLMLRYDAAVFLDLRGRDV